MSKNASRNNNFNVLSNGKYSCKVNFCMINYFAELLSSSGFKTDIVIRFYLEHFMHLKKSVDGF